MPTNNNPISVTYSDEKLRILIEEYITMQKKEFTFKGVCSFILYRAMEEERTASVGLYNTNQLSNVDCERVRTILKKIIGEHRLTADNADADVFSDNVRFEKISN